MPIQTEVSQTNTGVSGWVDRMGTERAMVLSTAFSRSGIILCIPWYSRYCLSHRDLDEMMAARGVDVDHSTIARWVLRYVLNNLIRQEMRNPNRSWAGR